MPDEDLRSGLTAEEEEPDDGLLDPSAADWEGDHDEEPASSPRYRRAALVIAVIVAASLVAVPIGNALRGTTPPVADNGLEICGFDYCEVFDAVRQAGLDGELLRLANTFLTDEEAVELTIVLVERLGAEPVTVEVVDRLPGTTAGRFLTADRHVQLQRPVRAWTVAHEAAHAVAGGHGVEFQRALVDLVEWLGDGRTLP